MTLVLMQITNLSYKGEPIVDDPSLIQCPYFILDFNLLQIMDCHKQCLCMAYYLYIYIYIFMLMLHTKE